MSLYIKILIVFWTVLGCKLEKTMAPHSSTLAWKIPWMEEPGRLQSAGSLRVGHDWSDLAAAAAGLVDLWGRFSYLSLLFFGNLHSDACIFPFLLCFSLLVFSLMCIYIHIYTKLNQAIHLRFVLFILSKLYLNKVSGEQSVALYTS